VLRARGKGGGIVVELDEGGDNRMGEARAKGLRETWAKDQNCSHSLDEKLV
jgi:hypothetical protein